MDELAKAISWTSGTNLPKKRDAGSVNSAYRDRMMLSEAIDAATRMIGAYPNGGANAGKSYIGAIAGILCEYPRHVARQCADPIRGVTRQTKFLPTVADIVAFCDPLTAKLKWSDDWAYRSKLQLAERDQIESQSGPSDGFLARMRDEMAAHGMHILGSKPYERPLDPVAEMKRLGFTQEQWEAVPDQPAGATYWKQLNSDL